MKTDLIQVLMLLFSGSSSAISLQHRHHHHHHRPHQQMQQNYQSFAQKQHHHHVTNHAKFITDNLKDIIAAGPELGALQNKLKAVEALKSRINTVDAGVAELIKPLPRVVVVKKKAPKPVEVVIDDNDEDQIEPHHVKQLEKVLDEKKAAINELDEAIKDTNNAKKAKHHLKGKVSTKRVAKAAKNSVMEKLKKQFPSGKKLIKPKFATKGIIAKAQLNESESAESESESQDDQNADELNELVKELKGGKKYKFDAATKDLAKQALSKLEGSNHKHPQAVFASNEIDKISQNIETEKSVKKIKEKAEDVNDEDTAKDAKKVLDKIGNKDTKDQDKEQ